MTESEIQKEIIKYCRSKHKDDFFIVGIPNEAIFKAMSFIPKKLLLMMYNKLLAMGLRPGFPDLLVLRQGAVLAVELKTENGSLNSNQKKLFPILEKFIGPVRVARSFDDFLRVLKVMKFI